MKLTLTTETIVSETGLLSIEDEWRALWDTLAPPSPFLRYEWMAMCWRRVAAGDPDAPRLVTVRENGTLVLAAPLMRHRRFGLLHEFNGLTTTLPQYAEVLMRDSGAHKDWARAFLREALRHPLALRVCLGRLPAPSTFGVAATKLRATYTSYGAATLARLPDGYDAYLATRAKALRSDNRRQMHRLSETGPVSFRLADAETLDADLDWLLDQKRQWQPRSGALRVWFGLPEAENDLRGFCRDMLATGGVCLATLLAGGQRIGATLSFIAGSEAVVYVLAYDPRFASYSPGRTAMLLTLEACARQGVIHFDFMGGGAEWKQRLGTDEKQLDRVRFYRQ